jgi:hypothetical protein
MKGTCRLCRNESKLQLSHHYPRFLAKWLKKTGTGYFRVSGAPNKRHQDLPKSYLLCEDCEQRFSVSEKYFSEKIFHPYLEDTNRNIKYNELLHYFAVSLAWRSIQFILSDTNFTKHKFRKDILESDIEWREYLLGRRKNIKNDAHLFCVDILPPQELPIRGLSHYLARAVDSGVASNSTRCFAYVKIPRFIFYVHISDYPKEEWINTLIKPHGGEVQMPQTLEDGDVGEFLVNRTEQAFRDFRKNTSKSALSMIERNLEKNKDKYIDSDQFKAQIADYNSSVVRFKEPGRNDPCLCGSGLKYKKCCLK